MPWLLVSLLSLTLWTPTTADKLTKKNKQWLKLVEPIILREEAKLYEEIRKDDRPEFERIFWARRDPDPEAANPDNSFKSEYLEAREDVDSRFRTWGDSRNGWDTDCGRVFLALGAPNMVREGERRPERRQEVREGRRPEVWTYQGEQYEGGTLQVIFDQYCKLWHSTSVRTQIQEHLERAARIRVTRPDLEYRTNAEGRLVKLEDLAPAPSFARLLLEEQPQDFALEAQPKLSMRTRDGEATFTAGLIRGATKGLSVREDTGQKTVIVQVSGAAVDESGVEASSFEREATAVVDDEGNFVASYGLALKPGKYTVRVGALDMWTRVGSVTTFPYESPDFTADAEELALSELLIFVGSERDPSANPNHALADFTLGSLQLGPRYDNRFPQSEKIEVLSFVYNASVDSRTGKASLEATYRILGEGQPVSKDVRQLIETVDAVPMIGPFPLQRFSPGEYVVQLELTDRVSGKTYLKEARFTVEQPK